MAECARCEKRPAKNGKLCRYCAGTRPYWRGGDTDPDVTDAPADEVKQEEADAPAAKKAAAKKSPAKKKAAAKKG